LERDAGSLIFLRRSGVAEKSASGLAMRSFMLNMSIIFPSHTLRLRVKYVEKFFVATEPDRHFIGYVKKGANLNEAFSS
jgi:hypothetical protein